MFYLNLDKPERSESNFARLSRTDTHLPALESLGYLSRVHRHTEMYRLARVGGEQHHQRPIADAAVYHLAGAAVAGQQIAYLDARQSMFALKYVRSNAPTPLEHHLPVCVCVFV